MYVYNVCVCVRALYNKYYNIIYIIYTQTYIMFYSNAPCTLQLKIKDRRELLKDSKKFKKINNTGTKQCHNSK